MNEHPSTPNPGTPRKRKTSALGRRLLFVILATPVVFPGLLILDPSSGLRLFPSVQTVVGAALLLFVCALPAVHRFERFLAHELLGTAIAPQGRRTAWQRGAAFTLLHVVGGLSLGLSIAMIVVVVSEWTGFLAYAPSASDLTPQDFAYLYGQAMFSTAARAAAILIILGALVYAIGYTVCAPVIANRLFGLSTRDRLAESEAERERLQVQNEMARDIHDSLGHALTIASVQAESGRAQLSTSPGAADRALETIVTVCQRGQADLDDVLRLLRTGGSSASTHVRDLSGVGALVREVESAGLSVTTDFGPVTSPSASTEAGVAQTASPEVSRAMYRIVQEALTNALRYATVKQLELNLSVSDTGRVHLLAHNPADHAIRPEAGRGLNGIHARAQLLGGSSSFRQFGGRFVLEVNVPTQGGASA